MYIIYKERKRIEEQKNIQRDKLGRFVKGTPSHRRRDVVGQTFGFLTVQSVEYRPSPCGKQRAYCTCACVCGTVVTRTLDSLCKSKQPSCGCKRAEIMQERCRKDLTGQKFGRLTVIEMLWKANESTKCKCLCDCGNVVTALASGIKSGKTLSCGCLHSDRTRESNTKDWTGIKSDWGVTILRPYKQNDQGVWIWECECGLCGKHFYELPIKVLNGSQKSCGCAKRSSGEAHIEKYLREHSIIYKSQYAFKECKDKQVLLFDFAVFDDNGKLSFLIEYDGQQHYGFLYIELHTP